MSKMFAVQYANGHRVECTARQWAEARNQRNHEGTRFFIKGEEVDAATYYEACEVGGDAWFAKKSETHKRISVQHGVIPTSRVWIWVRR